MKKLLICLFSFIAGISIVACGNGNSGLDLNISPKTCSIAQNQDIDFHYSGLTAGESVDFRYTTPSAAIVYYAPECIVGKGNCPFQTGDDFVTMGCADIAAHGGNASGKYIFTLRQNSGSASDTLTIQP